MGRTVFIETSILNEQLSVISPNSFTFGLLCGQLTNQEKDYIHFIVDITKDLGTPLDVNSFDTIFGKSNKKLQEKIPELTTNLCAGVTILGFYCKMKSDILKSSNFSLKIRRLFDILQHSLTMYSPFSSKQSSHRLLLQSEYGNNSKWIVKTLDMNTDEINFRTADLKTYNKETMSYSIRTIIPIQLLIWLTPIIKNTNMKQIETEFEKQWKIYTDNLKESLLMVDNRLVLMNAPIFPQQPSQQVDVKWLSPIEMNLKDDDANNDRIRCQLQGSLTLRAYLTISKITGNELRQYFIEDLYRTMLIRFNLALLNNENENENETANDGLVLTNNHPQLVLPRRFYTTINQKKTLPLFITAYQLSNEPIQAVADCIKENFYLELNEEDLEAGEEFPLESTTEECTKKFNTTNTNDNGDTSLLSSKNSVEKLMQYISQNVVLIIIFFTIIVGLISAMLKLY
ncbi:unnamed protein product [Didymodactylos carnosus]|uniref:Uncharacterized protein n=1 Tax=Didymodactylos carnosus TaxID=1234261 RepID=A0A813ZKY4_9BILA|nr:unnamed protein product [Didymodactylos carnosus]CAF0899979.1 unnamed protein product [Didymodactylos carnosus]CAF3548131.1 unnamed protein product [Didymodactylos carnosus]CAF3682616.1 unnamed protein product [Didymodactylos carnosus]